MALQGAGEEVETPFYLNLDEGNELPQQFPKKDLDYQGSKNPHQTVPRCRDKLGC